MLAMLEKFYSRAYAGHFSDITYVHLTKCTIQEENLAVQEAFEKWTYTF